MHAWIDGSMSACPGTKLGEMSVQEDRMWECEDSAECASSSERLCSPEAGGSVRWTATHGGLESKHRNRLQAL